VEKFGKKTVSSLKVANEMIVTGMQSWSYKRNLPIRFNLSLRLHRSQTDVIQGTGIRKAYSRGDIWTQ
jgi:hypothetical protein